MYKYIYIFIRASPSLYQEEGDVVTSKNSYCAKAVSVTQKHTPALSQTETNYSYLSFRRKLQRE